MHRFLFATLAVAVATLTAFAEDSSSTAMLRNTGGSVIEIVGTAGEPLGRTVSAGWSLALSEGRPAISALSANQALVVWYGTGCTAVSILEASAGTLREVWSDAFEPGWTIHAAGDFNKDGRPDFLMVKTAGEGDDRSFSCAVAVWDRKLGIDVVTDPVTIVPRCRGAYFTTGDMDGDGAADVVFDEGQCHVAFNKGDGRMENLKESVDLRTTNERDSADQYMATAFLADVDNDGKRDLVARCDFIPEKAWEIRIHLGTGGGQFEEKGKVFASGEYAKAPMPSLAWIAWPGRDAQPPDVEPPAKKEMEEWWTALGSAKPREAARAMGSFLRAGAAAAPFLAEHVPAGAALDEDRVGALIRDLDDEDIAVREKASAALLGLADVAEPLLKTAMGKTTSAEVKARLREILENPPAGKLSDLKAGEHAMLRLLALLEAIDTPEAREAVARLVQPNVSLPLRSAAGETVRRQKRK